MKLFICLLLIFVAVPVMGSHLLGGYISYKLSNDRKVTVTVHLLTDANSDAQAGDAILDFGDGNSYFISATDFSVAPLKHNVYLVTFSTDHLYTEPGVYKISYSERNYSGGIRNMTGSSGIPFYISSTLRIDPAVSENTSAVLHFFQGQRGAAGKEQRINPAPFDPDNDSLSYKLIVPAKDNESIIKSYTHPNDTAFYTDYLRGNEEETGPPIYAVNAATGEILWDAPELTGAYVIAYRITQWRKTDGIWSNIGATEVIMIDLITDTRQHVSIEPPESQCYNDQNEINGPFTLTASNDESITAKVFTDLPDGSINGVSFKGKKYIELTFSNELTINLDLPANLNLEPYKLYRIVVQVGTKDVLQSSSWAFSIGCATLPGDIFPDPIIPEEIVKEFLVYPNPTFKKSIRVVLPEDTDKLRNIRIINSKGKVVYSHHDFVSEKINFDLSGLSAGLYLIQIDGYTGKFIVGQ